MRSFLRQRVVNILSYFSRKNLSRFEPLVIAITGNIGKTTTKDYIYNFLKTKWDVRASKKSENSEFGVNLTILGEDNAWNSVWGWIKIILRNFFRLFKKNAFPKILVLEVGADKPGDIRYITTIVRPDLVVLTAFQETPTHGEFFQSVEQHIAEKKVLVDKMKSRGVIVYNKDDTNMSKIAEEKVSKSPNIKSFSFGSSVEANVIILETTNIYSETAEIEGLRLRLGLQFDNFKDELDLRFLGIVGTAQSYSIAAAVCVALLNEFKRDDLLEAVKNINNKQEFAKSRMRLFDGVVGTKIIDDSYNSSPKACKNAIETVAGILNKGKKIGILGSMAELGEKTKEAHVQIGELAAKTFETIIFVGKFNEFFLEGVRNVKGDLSKVYLAENSIEVLQILSDNNLIREDDLILVKGSQSVRLEKVVVEILANPHDRDLVCRQDLEWKNR